MFERKVYGIYNGQNRKRKIENEKFLKIKIPVTYTRTHTCVRAKNAGNVMFLCMCDAVNHRKIAFKPIFSPVERFSCFVWIVVRVG